MKRNQRPPATPEMLEHLAENTKERIYATITLLAVIATLWQATEIHSHIGAVASIAGTAIALLLATMISARMSYRAVHGKSMGLKDYRKLIFTSSGLLIPAVVPILLVAASGVTEWFSLKGALFTSMVVLVFSMFIFSFIAGRKIYTSLLRTLGISAIEMLLGIGVIALKVAIGE